MGSVWTSSQLDNAQALGVLGSAWTSLHQLGTVWASGSLYEQCMDILQLLGSVWGSPSLYGQCMDMGILELLDSVWASDSL